MKIDENKNYAIDFKSEEDRTAMWLTIKCIGPGAISGMDSIGRKHEDPEGYIKRLAQAIEHQYHAMNLYEALTLPGGFNKTAFGGFLLEVDREMPGLLKHLTIRELAE